MFIEKNDAFLRNLKDILLPERSSHLPPRFSRLPDDCYLLGWASLKVVILGEIRGSIGRQSRAIPSKVNSDGIQVMEHDETGCQTPEGPILCINNCGFFGSAATMNMCSKCHKDMILKQEQAKLAASSIGNLVKGNGSSSSSKDLVISVDLGAACGSVEPKSITAQPSDSLGLVEDAEAKVKAGPNRCNMCSKRIGLTGFTCRCGNIFCSLHRYTDKHNCTFDYRTAGRDAIAKANPVVKAEKLDKI